MRDSTAQYHVDRPPGLRGGSRPLRAKRARFASRPAIERCAQLRQLSGLRRLTVKPQPRTGQFQEARGHRLHDLACITVTDMPMRIGGPRLQARGEREQQRKTRIAQAPRPGGIAAAQLIEQDLLEIILAARHRRIPDTQLRSEHRLAARGRAADQQQTWRALGQRRRETATLRCMSILHVRTVFQGRVITVNVETVRLPNGHVSDLEIIHHPGGAAIVAVDEALRVCLLRQYRHAAGGWIWELPAGKLEPQEPPLVTARRELAEEAGRSAGRWRSLGNYVSSPGVFTEIVHLYLAEELDSVKVHPEEGELIEVHWIDLRQACERAENGDINDGKTALGLLRARRALGDPSLTS